MKKLLLILALGLLTMGQDCDKTDPEPPPPPPDPVSEYCYGNDYSVLQAALHQDAKGEEVGLFGGKESILHGDPSTDPRATVYVAFGSSYCTGVALSPTIVLTAGHCGYGSDTAHAVYTFSRDQSGALHTDQRFGVKKHVVHPDYLKYVYSGNRDMEARKADLMLLFLEEPLPDSYLRVAGFYDSKFAKFCRGMVAQGFGRHETPGRDLRETKYVITQVTDKYLISRAAEVPPGEEAGRICFGDSGGPLYADVGGVPYLAGVTTTTMSSDCERGGTHVRLTPFIDWIIETIKVNQ